MAGYNLDMTNGYYKEKTRILVDWVGQNKTVLDLGCYDGRDSVLYVKNNNKVYGVDLLKENTQQAAKRGIITETFNLETKKKWPYKEKFFDLVVCGDIIEHIVDVDTFLQNINEILKLNGELIITTPNLASIGRRLLLLFGKNPYIEVSYNENVNGFPAVGHVKYFTIKTLSTLVETYGFKVTSYTSDNINIGKFHSIKLAKLMPTLSWRIILKAKKIKHLK